MKKSPARKLLRILLFTFCALLVLTIAGIFALTLPAVQQFLTNKTQTFLQKKLKTRVEVGAVRVRFPIDVSLENFLLEDENGDTLAQIGSLVVAVDMFKLLGQTIELQKIELENAAVFLHQKDSVSNNYNFISRAFSPDSTAVASPDTTASPWKLRLDLTVLQLKNVNFLLKNDGSESMTAAKIGTAETVIASADLKKLQFELKNFALADSEIQLIEKKKSTPSGKPSPNFEFILKNADIARSHLVYSVFEMDVDANLERTTLENLQIQSENGEISIQSNGIKIENSALAYRDPETKNTPGHFNGGDLDFENLNADLPTFFFQNDTIFVQADAVSGSDKSGLQIHSLRTTARVTPKNIEIKNALADLNRTHFDGDVLLFQNEKATFDRMKINIRAAKGIVGDLLIFMPPPEIQAISQLQNMPFEMSGNLSGWLENLQTENIKFRAGSGTVANFTGSVQQITEPEKIGMHLKINRLETNRSDLVRFMSLGETHIDSILAQPLPAFLSTSGEVSGNMASLDLNLRGEVGRPEFIPATQVGINSDLQFEVAGNLKNANDPDKLAMDLQIKKLDAPRSFFAIFEKNDLQFPDSLQATGTLRGTFSALQTDLKFIAERGGISSNLDFSGLLKNVRTPENLGFDVVFDGNFSRQEILGYVADSLITNDLRLPDFIKLNGKASGTVQDATAKTELVLGSFGKIFLDGNLRDSTFQMAVVAQNLMVNRLAVDSNFQGIKTVGLTAKINGTGFDFFKTSRLNLAGKFDSLIYENLILREIALDFAMDGRKFSGGFESPDERAAVRARVVGDFTTNLPLLELDVNLNCLDLREFGWSRRPTNICGHILSSSAGLDLDTLTAKISIQNLDLQYDTVHVRPGDLVLDLKFDNQKNQISLASDWLETEVSGYFSLTDLPQTFADIFEKYFVVDRTDYVARVGTDSISVKMQLKKTDVLTTGLVPGLTELEPMNLEGKLVAARNFFNLEIQMPRMVYQDWAVDSMNLRSFAGDSAAMFSMTSPLVKRGEKDFIENAVLHGRFLANVADVSFKASSDDGRERFLLVLQAFLDNNKKETLVKLVPRQVIDFKEWAVNSENQVKITAGVVEIKNFEMTGDGQSIKINGASSKTGLDFAVDIARLNFGNFDIFVADILSDLDGWAEANLKISGTAAAPQVRGKMQFHETFFTPVATNVRYGLSETPLEFSATGINLDGLKLTDPFGKTLEINGKLATTDWQKIEANLKLHADRWQVLNSTKQQNPVYFGELYVSLDGTVRGDLAQPDVQITVKTAKESTFTYIYDVATQSLQHEGIVYFLQPPRQNVRPPIYDAPVNSEPFTLSASVEIDTNLTIASVINPVTGDDFRGKANGRLQFDMLSNGNMTLSGQVELVRGVYNYSYQSVVKRSFEVTTGSTITWTGDATRPELDLKARYQFKASPFPLVVNQLSTASTEEQANYRKPQVFFLQTTLSGSATQPDINFQFIYPSAEKQESLGANFGNQQSDLVQSALGNVNEDKNLLSRQVFGVLLLKNFIGESVGNLPTGSGGNPLQTGLTEFLSGQINALADQYLNFIDIDLATTDNTSSQSEGTTNYQLSLQKSFFEDRLTFKISGGTAVDGSGGDTQTALENASVEYALTRNGELKMTVFSEKGFELLNATSANLRNSGAGLILSKEFGGKK